LLAVVGDEDENVRSETASTLAKVGKKDINAITKLISLLFDDTNPVKFAVSKTMIEENVDAYLFLTWLLSRKSNSNQTQRISATNSSNSKGIIDQLKQSDQTKRKELLQNLKTEEFLNESLMDLVISIVSNKAENEEETRVFAIQSIGQMDSEQLKGINPKQSEKLKECLLSFLDGDENEVKLCSLETIESLGISDKKIADKLVDLLMKKEEEEDEIREACSRILGYLGITSEKILNGLVDCLKDELVEVRQHCATSLGLLGVGTEKVISALTATTKDEEYIVRNEASKALKILEKAGSFLMI